ncbi:enoyl-CoA hydratase/isomerase family protein [Seohaeicola zhoushanensis]|uniref:Enoyl-CoA hydratase n=1 Tax=Seohaeicola zhoushanensis TaxID=1569283 RepID=A0A8J3H1M4_9RHOB|nr:enoyl-CoA hydratase-related protein [Seohaeicola zhoushanensis]GHF64468.1 enoyl-CoA hydratase [Seohaeicola zhoushanensis]
MSDIDVRQEGRVTVFTINRPEKLNAISSGVAVDLQKAFEEFDASDQRVAVLCGAGEKAFTSGADVTDLPELWRCVPAVGIRTNKPIICAVDGWCVGGGLVMAATSDLCVATERAKFSYPEAKLGLTGGIIAALAARIPHKMAMEVMLLGRPVSGRRAYEMGLVNEIAPEGKHVEVALGMAQELAGMAPLVLGTLKAMVNDHMLVKSPSEQMALTQAALNTVRNSADLQEGLAAYREKRSPNFTGK